MPTQQPASTARPASELRRMAREADKRFAVRKKRIDNDPHMPTAVKAAYLDRTLLGTRAAAKHTGFSANWISVLRGGRSTKAHLAQPHPSVLPPPSSIEGVLPGVNIEDPGGEQGELDEFLVQTRRLVWRDGVLVKPTGGPLYGRGFAA